MKAHSGGLRHLRRYLRVSTARLVFSVMMVIAILGAAASPVEAGGTITHYYVSDQALSVLNSHGYSELYQILDAHRGAVSYGSVFPDWGYQSFVQSISAAATPNFVKEYCKPYCENWGYLSDAFDHGAGDKIKNEIMSRIRYPLSEEDAESMAFLYGMISHLAADGAFHGQYDFLKAARDPSLGNYGDETKMAEFLIEENVDLSVREQQIGYLNNHSCDGWSFPTKARQAIVSAYQGQNSTWNVNDTMLLMGFGWQSELCFGEKVEPIVHGMDWINANFVNYPNIRYDANATPWVPQGHGGLKDMYQNHVPQAWEAAWNEWIASLRPVTSLSYAPVETTGGRAWYYEPVDNRVYRQAVMVTLTTQTSPVVDGSYETLYRLNDSGQYQKYTGPFQITAEGVYRIKYYTRGTGSISAIQEDARTEEIKVDLVPAKSRLFAGRMERGGRQFSPSERYYQVQGGDTLFAIAQNYGVPFQALWAANTQIDDPNTIYRGELIQIPDSRSERVPRYYETGGK